VNERLTELRKALDLSMEKFGSKIGISRSGISKMENGLSGLSEQTIRSICREFHVNYFWLTEGKGEMFTGVPQTVIDELVEQYDLDEDDRKIIENYLNLSAEKRDIFKELVKNILN